MLFVGIDPGITGGLAIVSVDKFTPPSVEDGMRTPFYRERGKKLVDSDKIFRWLMQWPIDVAVIEWVHAFPQGGVSSSFSFGRSTGAVEAVAALITRRIHWVTPAVWKKSFGLSKNKQASIDKACSVYGDSYKWTAKADDGIAEAALLCQWYVDTKLK